MTNGSNANGVPGEAGFNAALPVPLDSVQEFRVTVGGQGANLGRSSGGQVTLVTKSGSNDFHGSLYEFHRNTATAANNWFSNRAGIPREHLVRNQFGGSAGGRLDHRDRAFFFVNYEQRIDASARAETRNVPTACAEARHSHFPNERRNTDTVTLAEVMQVDPQKLGYTSAMQQYLAFYPTGNDPNGGRRPWSQLHGLSLQRSIPSGRQSVRCQVRFQSGSRKQARSVLAWNARGQLAGSESGAASPVRSRRPGC